jgi:hypothetical protein
MKLLNIKTKDWLQKNWLLLFGFTYIDLCEKCIVSIIWTMLCVIIIFKNHAHFLTL